MPTIFYAGPDNTAPTTGDVVTFAAGRMPGGDGVGINSVAWDFGDGYTGTGAITTHTYSVPGNYTWTAEVVTTSSGTFNFDGPITASAAIVPPGRIYGVSENTLFIPVKKVTNAEFASIQMRGVRNALPTTMLDNGGYPDRELFFWPVPNDGSKAIELWIWEPLKILDLDAELNLPPGYERYYIYALAMELCDTFGKRPTKEIIRSLMEAESAIKTLNQLDFRVAPSSGALEMNRNNRAYNIIDFRAGANMLPRTDQ